MACWSFVGAADAAKKVAFHAPGLADNVSQYVPACSEKGVVRSKAARHVKNELTNTQIATYGKNNIAAMPVDIRWWPHDATPEWSQNATIAESPERFALHHDD